MDDEGVLHPDKTFHYHINPFEGANLEQAALEFNGIDPHCALRGAIEESEAMGDQFNILDLGLLTYMQNLGQSNELESNQISITPRVGTSETEQIDIRLDGLTLFQLTNILNSLYSYDNISVITLNIRRQFNDETRLLITMNIVKEIV